MDGLLRVIGFEEEELRNDRCGHRLVDFAIETDYSFLEQAREDVVWSVLLASLIAMSDVAL